MKFIHLHTHSHYSLLDGLPKIDELIQKAKEYGMEALGLTDHGTMYGSLEFYQKAKAAGIKPIVGVEFYLALQSRYDRRPKIDDFQYHLVLLAKNLEGYKNLMRLTTQAHLEGFYYKPRIDKELLKEHSSGLICLSGCLKGEIPYLLLKGDEKGAKKAAHQYQEIFGNDFYLELQYHPDIPSQIKANQLMIDLARELKIPLVVTRDSHYLSSQDQEAQEVLICIATGKVMSDKNRFSMSDFDASFVDSKKMEEAFLEIPQALDNTLDITLQCNLDLELNNWHFPYFEVPEKESADAYLEKLVDKGIKKRLNTEEIDSRVLSRLNYELNIIKKKKYATYFLVVADCVTWAKSQGIMATTRGSAAGSLVAWALGITTINPLAYQLPFERFLNPDRPSPPDIDLDFADNRRDEVIQYVTQKYGQDKVAQIGTFGTLMAKAAVRDVTRVLGLPYLFGDKIAKLIPFGSQGFPMTINLALKMVPELKNLYDSDGQVKRVINLAKQLEGSARHASVHAAGLVISPLPLTEYVPLQREPGGDKIITQYDMESVEAAGLIKMDFLGIRNLSILGYATKLIKKTKNIEIDLEHLPLEDKKTYTLLSQGETMGLFQLGGSGMTRYLKELKPTSIFDIMAMVALFRPGPMESIPEFIKRKHNPKLIQYLDPRLKDILGMSYGVITYQDDVLEIARLLAGYSWREADQLRKAMGKKIPREMNRQKEKFLDGCFKNGLKKEKAKELWELIEPFAAYGFNKAHAASYAMVAYETAYLKAHFPCEFMTAVMTAESGNEEKIALAVEECRSLNIKVLSPNINESLDNFTYLNDREIRFGMLAIKNIGSHLIETIIKERERDDSFRSLEDFLKRINCRDLNKKSLESLIKAGALDELGERNLLLYNIEKLLNYNRACQKESNNGQINLFTLMTGQPSTLPLTPTRPASQKEKLTWEKELLGLYVTAHPFYDFESRLREMIVPLGSFLEGKLKNGYGNVAGIITSIKKIITKNGEPMLFVKIEDLTAQVEALVFPRLLKLNPSIWQEDKIIIAKARPSDKEGDVKLIIEKAEEVTETNLNKIII